MRRTRKKKIYIYIAQEERKVLKVEDYKFIVNDKEVTTIEEWFREFKKLSRTDFAFEESKKDVYKKIEDGVYRLELEI